MGSAIKHPIFPDDVWSSVIIPYIAEYTDLYKLLQLTTVSKLWRNHIMKSRALVVTQGKHNCQTLFEKFTDFISIHLPINQQSCMTLIPTRITQLSLKLTPSTDGIIISVMPLNISIDLSKWENITHLKLRGTFFLGYSDRYQIIGIDRLSNLRYLSLEDTPQLGFSFSPSFSHRLELDELVLLNNCTPHAVEFGLVFNPKRIVTTEMCHFKHFKGEMELRMPWREVTDFYRGEWDNGKLHGKGRLESGSFVWEGEWRENKLVNGRITDLMNQSSYEGGIDCFGTRPDGEGCYREKGKVVYNGKWDLGKPLVCDDLTLLKFPLPFKHL